FRHSPFYRPHHHPHLHSFPTRRSSDLSESLTSYPASSASPPRIRLVRSVPWPPTPTIIIFFTPITFHLPLPVQSLQTYRGIHRVRIRYTWCRQSGSYRLHFLSWPGSPVSYTCRIFYIFPDPQHRAVLVSCQEVRMVSL